jgi:hypothetical protein
VLMQRKSLVRNARTIPTGRQVFNHANQTMHYMYTCIHIIQGRSLL